MRCASNLTTKLAVVGWTGKHGGIVRTYRFLRQGVHAVGHDLEIILEELVCKSHIEGLRINEEALERMDKRAGSAVGET